MNARERILNAITEAPQTATAIARSAGVKTTRHVVSVARATRGVTCSAVKPGKRGIFEDGSRGIIAPRVYDIYR